MHIHHLALATCLLALPACSTATQPRAITASAACDRLPDTNRVVADMFNGGEAYAARPAEISVPIGRAGSVDREVGAELYVHATPGTSGRYLQRVLECYTSRNEAGHPNDPFHPTSGSVASVTVQPAGDSFAVLIVGSDDEAAQDIWNRAQALTASVSAEQIGSASPRYESASLD